jgi:hypothetical protein
LAYHGRSWHIEAAIWHIEAAIWHIEAAIWHIEAAIWHIEAAIWHMEVTWHITMILAHSISDSVFRMVHHSQS